MSPSAPKLSRRTLLLGAASVPAVAALDAFAIEPRWLEITRHDVPVPGCPSSVEGLSIAQLTDVHLSSLGGLERSVIDALRAARPQIVVITGDAVDSPDKLPVLTQLVGELASSGARLFGLAGNWEHWGKISLGALAQTYKKAGGQLLVNESVSAHGVSIAATDDGLAGRPDLPVVFSGARSEASVLLTHSPALLDTAATDSPRFALALAGHTHGGQGRIGPFAPLLPPGSGRFVAGFYETKLGRAYVSRGLGTSVLPARFACRPELPIFRLVRG